MIFALLPGLALLCSVEPRSIYFPICSSSVLATVNCDALIQFCTLQFRSLAGMVNLFFYIMLVSLRLQYRHPQETSFHDLVGDRSNKH